jgi:hypothetical protein
MRKFRTGVAIAALMIAAPTMACTDWKAIAMFDQAEVATTLAIWSKVGPDANHWAALTAARDRMAFDRTTALADTCGGQQ